MKSAHSGFLMEYADSIIFFHLFDFSVFPVVESGIDQAVATASKDRTLKLFKATDRLPLLLKYIT